MHGNPASSSGQLMLSTLAGADKVTSCFGACGTGFHISVSFRIPSMRLFFKCGVQNSTGVLGGDGRLRRELTKGGESWIFLSCSWTPLGLASG